MRKKIEKQPGKILMPYYICSHCGYENEMPKYALAPDGTFKLVLNNKRGMAIDQPASKIVFVCLRCNRNFTLGLKEYVEPKISN